MYLPVKGSGQIVIKFYGLKESKKGKTKSLKHIFPFMIKPYCFTPSVIVLLQAFSLPWFGHWQVSTNICNLSRFSKVRFVFHMLVNCALWMSQ